MRNCRGPALPKLLARSVTVVDRPAVRVPPTGCATYPGMVEAEAAKLAALTSSCSRTKPSGSTSERSQ